MNDFIKNNLSEAFHNKINRTGNKSAFGNSFVPHKHTPEHLIQHITQGKAWTQGYFKGRNRRKENFVSAQTLALDLDDKISVDDALSKNIIRQHAILVHPSPSSTLEHPKTRVVFLLDEAIDDVHTWEQLQKALIEYFADLRPDPACKDAARLFYGSDQPGAHINLTARLPRAIVAGWAKENIDRALEASRTDAPGNIRDKGGQGGKLSPELVRDVEIALGIHNAPVNGEGFLIKPIACPVKHHEHDHQTPGAYWHPGIHALKCFKCGETYNTHQVADALGIDTAPYYQTLESAQAWTDLPETDQFQHVNTHDMTTLFHDVIAPGAYLIKSQQATGKTELAVMLKTHFERQGLTVGGMGPRQSIVGDLARRMECDSSNSMNVEHQILHNTFMMCLPSIVHQVGNAGLKIRHVLILDEVEQILSLLMSSIIKPQERISIFNMLIAMIQGATYVYCFDADAGKVAYTFIQFCRADVQFIINDHQNTNRQLSPYPDKYSLKAGLDRAIEQTTDPIAVSTSSEKHAKELHREYAELLGEEAVLLICKDTKPENRVTAFLNHPDKHVSNYRLIIYTSAMGTGVNIWTPVKAVFGFFDRNPLDAYDMGQMIIRFRQAQDYNVWVSGSVQNIEADATTIYERYFRQEARTRHEIGYFDPAGNDVIKQRREWLARLFADVIARRNSSRRNLKQHFFRLAQTRFTILAERKSIPQSEKEEMKEISKERRAQLEKERRAMLKAVIPVSEAIYNRAARTGKLTVELETGHQRAIIEETYSETITDETITDFDAGRGIGRMLLFESLYQHASDAKVHDYEQLASQFARNDLSHRYIKRNLIMQILDPFVDERRFDTSIVHTLEYIEKQLQPIIDDQIGDIRTFLKWRQDYDEKPLNFLRFVLSLVGLKLTRHRERVNGVVQTVGYRLDRDSLLKMERYMHQRAKQREDTPLSAVLPKSV